MSRKQYMLRNLLHILLIHDTSTNVIFTFLRFVNNLSPVKLHISSYQTVHCEWCGWTVAFLLNELTTIESNETLRNRRTVAPGKRCFSNKYCSSQELLSMQVKYLGNFWSKDIFFSRNLFLFKLGLIDPFDLEKQVINYNVTHFSFFIRIR